jgi:general stress protein YciG
MRNRYFYGTSAGGKRAAATNKERYGEDMYARIGKIGGQISRGGGFQYGSELTVDAGRRGGKANRRTDKPKVEVLHRDFLMPRSMDAKLAISMASIDKRLELTEDEHKKMSEFLKAVK